MEPVAPSMINWLIKIPRYIRLAMSVMNEQLQRLMPSAYQSDVSLQTLALDGPYAALAQLSANRRLERECGAARGDAGGRRRLQNHISPDGRNDACSRRITRPAPAQALPGLRWCNELTPKTTESHWSGGQREP
jgi:hypothetical protein